MLNLDFPIHGVRISAQANIAMLDAAELALALVEHEDDVETALKRYEQAMFLRSAVAAAASNSGLELCFAADSPKGMVEFLTQHRA